MCKLGSVNLPFQVHFLVIKPKTGLLFLKNPLWKSSCISGIFTLFAPYLLKTISCKCHILFGRNFSSLSRIILLKTSLTANAMLGILPMSTYWLLVLVLKRFFNRNTYSNWLLVLQSSLLIPGTSNSRIS